MQPLDKIQNNILNVVCGHYSRNHEFEMGGDNYHNTGAIFLGPFFTLFINILPIFIYRKISYGGRHSPMSPPLVTRLDTIIEE